MSSQPDAAMAESVTIPTRNEATRSINALSKLVDSDDDTGAEESPVKAPRSKLLTRLRPQIDSSDSEEEEDDEDAYERVKRSLMAGSSNSEPLSEPKTATESVEVPSSDDEEDMPVQANNTRRRISRKATSSPPVSPLPSVRSRTSSPGLFVTPDASPATKRFTRTSPGGNESESGFSSGRKELNERVARIRAERLAAQAKERRQAAQSKKTRRTVDDGSSDDSDGENGTRLTQQSRPTRRAGKKALEEMAREQQRIKRGMQLTHQAKTKKKYSLKDLFPRLGLAQVGTELIPAPAMPTPDASSEVASSDVEARKEQDTPPTSPAEPEEEMNDAADSTDLSLAKEPVAETAESIPSSPVKMNKGKGRAPEFQHLPQNPLVLQSEKPTLKPRVSIKTPEKTKMIELSDSDDDLVIEKPKSRFPAFDKLPQRDQRQAVPLLHLRHLAQVKSPGKRSAKGQKSMNMTELHLSIAQKAREQARKEREEKIEELRRRGIHIETEEEREKQQLEIEDMVAQLEKAREKEMKLAKREREEAKKNGEEGDGLLSSDESEDEDYVGSGAEEVEMAEPAEEDAEIELSGSEEEELDEADDEEEPETNALVDDAAEESEEEEVQNDVAGDQPEAEDEEDDDLPTAPVRSRTVKRPRNVVLDDDEDSEKEAESKSSPTQPATAPSQTQEDDVMAAFGFNNAASGGGLGLTQMFAGTMANIASESNAHALDKEPEQDSLDFLRSLPDTQPGDAPGNEPDLLVPDTQNAATQQERDESQFSLGISQVLQSSPASQHSDVFDPTQDAGFELPRSPAGLVEPTSTVETVLLRGTESPAVRKGRLHQRKPAPIAELSDVDEDLAAGSDFKDAIETSQRADAFAVLKKAAKKQKKAADNFNKKTSWARDAIEEQAEESEDEYAGIGGASDEDSGEEDEELNKMIDTSDVKVDEAKLAAYYAEKSKADDEKNVNQLYKDLMHGGLRKRRGGDAFDMSDSEDEREQRLRKKRQEFQRMTNALLADERVGEIAKNPKRQAFFHTMVDSLEDPDYDFLDGPEMEANGESSPSQSDEAKEAEDGTEITVPDSQVDNAAGTDNITANINPLKRKSPSSHEKENRPPPHLRRTAPANSMSRKPMTLSDIQHSVSELLEDHHIMVPDSQFSDSDSELEIEAPEAVFKKPIIDRLSRTSTASETTTVNGGNVAFVAPTGAQVPGFRVPALVRRATSNFATVSTGNSGTTTPVDGTGVRRGGTGRSNIHAQAREAERRAAVEKVEAKRKESLKKKVGKARGARSVLRCLDGGFE